MIDDIFGGVIISKPETQLIVQITPQGQGNSGQSGFSGYSGAGGGSGGSGAGLSGFSGGSGKSGFSGFSSRSGYSGFSGLGTSGFSGFSGTSGTSGAAGGNSGYSGYSGLDGTFSASGFSGFSGFSSRSGFSGYSGSGVSGFSGYSGFSGQSASGFSGFSGPGTSGFSGFSSSGHSGFSGFSGSGISGYSGAGSPSTGSAGDFQYADGAGGFSGHPSLNFSGGTINANTNAFRVADNSDPTKKITFSLANIPSGTTRSVLVAGAGNPVVPGADSGTANQFLTGITPLAVITKAQVDFGNLSGLAGFGQLDRTTTVAAEAATLTIAANTKIKSSCSGVLTTIAFSGGASAAQARRLDLDITGGPYTLTIPSCRRLGETGLITSLQVFAGYNEFSWEFINGEYVLSDSVSTPGAGTSGFSGYAGTIGVDGQSGFSGRSGYSGGTGSSGFSGYSGAGSSGFSGFSAPNILTFSNHNDTDYTLVLGDANTGVKMASTAAHNLTVPPNSSVAFPVGTQIPVEQGDTGLVTIVAGAGVTLQGASTTSGLYSVVVLIKQATDTWLVAKSGASGYSGFSGGAGSAGASGASGYSGAGTSGFSGFSGAGISGFSGFSGFSSLSGFSGKSGYSGYSAPQLLTFSTQTDTDYTLVLGDANTGVKMSSSAGHNLTVPANASVAFAVGTQIPVEQAGSGVVTIVADVGVTLQGGTVTAGQYSLVVLIKQATDTWLVSTGNSGYSGFIGGTGSSGFSGFSSFSGYSGTAGWTRVFVSGSDATTTGQSLVDITGLVSGTLSAASQYEIHAVLRVSTSADTNGIQYGIHGGGTGSAATVGALLTGTVTATTAQTVNMNAIDTATSASAPFLTSNGTNGAVEISGFVTTRSTGTPTISIQHLKTTSGTSTVKIGSYFEYRAA